MVQGYPINLPGFEGTDATTDPYILGKKSTTKSSMGYNFRAKNNVRVSRGGYPPVLDRGNSVWFPKSGVYFPNGAKAILPHTSTVFDNTTFYLGSDSAGGISQHDFTISFRIKFSWKPYTRTVCRIPVDFTDDGATYTSHLHVELYPGLDENVGLKRTYLRMAMMVENGGNIDMAQWTTVSPNLGMVDFQDDTWTHIAITRGVNNPDNNASPTGTRSYLQCYGPDDTDMFAPYQMTDPGSYFPYPSADTSSFAADQDSPLMYNHLEIGDTELSIAEFRIWNKELRQGGDYSEIEDIAYEELVGTETGLVCYCPFNEGGGKYFEDKANQYGGDATANVRGYFTPNEPWVDDDDRLIFTGYNCMAYPSLRPRIPDLPSASAAEKLPDDATFHMDHSQDAAYDGGILWDTQINLADKSSWDFEDEGIYYGSAQIKFVLRQLKEGIICGRLGLLFDPDGEAYRFFFLSDDDNTSTTITYLSEPIVDEDWLGVEKRITIIYEGDTQTVGAETTGKFSIYVDSDDTDQAEDDQTWSLEATWANGDTIYGDYIPYNNTTGTNNSDGAIGGSPRQPDMCIAFDLIYFRQWWGPPPQGDTIADTLSITDVDNLTEVSKYLFKDIHGYIEDFSDSIVCTIDGNLDYPPNIGSGDSQIVYACVRLPMSDEFAFDMDGANSYIYFDDGGTKRVFKQDTIVKRVIDWEGPTTTLTNSCQIQRNDELFLLTGNFGIETERKQFFNGAIFSNLVNEFGPEQFQNNKKERLVFSSDDPDLDGTETVITTGKLYLTIEDGSPLQGTDKTAGITYGSRYLILGAESRDVSIRNMRSLQPRWCTGPEDIEPTNHAPVRGICRYTSESEDVDKLLAVAWSGVHEINTTTGALTPIDFGWLDSNSSEPVNFALVNNTLVIMDTKSAIKMNFKGKMSRLGIERPADIDYEYEVDTSTGMFETEDQYAYTAQFYDSENNSYSGTLPVFSDEKQTIKVGDTSTDEIMFGDIIVRACKDPNVDRVLIYRTLNLGSGGGGSETELFKIAITGNNKDFYDYVEHRDVWDDTMLPTQAKFLPSPYYGDTLVPKTCKALGVGLNRLWTGNASDAASTVWWSGVTALGFPKPDHFPFIQNMIIEEGGTTKITAIIEYSERLFIFKNGGIFAITETSPGEYRTDVVYKGVGAVNQRCALVAGESLLFLDRSGPHVYRSGEPQIASPDMIDWFRNEVNQTTMPTVAFMVYHKKEEQVLIFVPSSGSSYCDRCLSLDLRTGASTIDLVPQVTCGYVDEQDDTLYLGTPYGQILKYDPETFVDVLDNEYTGTVTLS